MVLRLWDMWVLHWFNHIVHSTIDIRILEVQRYRRRIEKPLLDLQFTNEIILFPIYTLKLNFLILVSKSNKSLSQFVFSLVILIFFVRCKPLFWTDFFSRGNHGDQEVVVLLVASQVLWRYYIGRPYAVQLTPLSTPNPISLSHGW